MINAMWLKEYLNLGKNHPLWVYVVDDLLTAPDYIPNNTILQEHISEVDARSNQRVGRLRIAGASVVMIDYNPAVGWQQKGGESKQQTRYKAPGKGLRGPLSQAGGGEAGAPSVLDNPLNKGVW
ncbi:hypothetical protein GGG16DRAFT_101185 [Schizophyllum commune]